MFRSLRFAALICLGLIAAVTHGCKKNPPQATAKPLICHIGGTMRPAMEKIVELYQAKTGQPIEINSADSGELLAHIQMQKSGDVYVCHDPFLDILMRKYDLGVDAWTVAEVTPVIAVKKGNPKNIKGIADLKRDDVVITLTDRDNSTLGRLLPTIFARAGVDLDELTRRKEIATHRSGGSAATMVQTGNADATIVWKAVVALRAGTMDMVPIPEPVLPVPYLDAVTSATGIAYKLTPVRVTIATLKCSAQPDAAAKFAEFVASEEAGKVFEKFGFTMDGGIVRKEFQNGKKLPRGNLRMYAGAGLRVGLDEMIRDFEAVSGVHVEADYGGSGLIISRARLDDQADLFMPGDEWYVDELAAKSNLIESKTSVAHFVPVIVVAKGNPKGVKGLADFQRKDLVVAWGKPDACQVGRLCAELFKKNNIDVSGINAKESLTVNELGVWVKTGDVDATIVWDAIAAGLGDKVEVIRITPEQSMISNVVVGLMKTSHDKAAAKSFIKFMAGPAGQAILAKNGYSTSRPSAETNR